VILMGYGKGDMGYSIILWEVGLKGMGWSVVGLLGLLYGMWE